MKVIKMSRAQANFNWGLGFFVVLMTLLVQTATLQAANEEIEDVQAAKVLKLSSVNINQANAKEISQVLIGVGKSKAEAIVAYREQNGNFSSLEDLLKVKGVGKKLLEKNRDKISL